MGSSTVGGAAASGAAVGRACGKVILVGEHFVLDGAAALAMPLADFWTEVRWPDSTQPLTLVTNATLSSDDRKDAVRMLIAAANAAGLAPRGVVTVESTVPGHRGFGSSAAFAVACLRALGNRTGENAGNIDLITAARSVEDVVHGRSSGLDPATAMGDGAVVFQGGRVVERVKPHQHLRPARWVLCDVGPAPSTGDAIRGANAARVRLGPEATAALVRRIGNATQNVIRGLRTGDAACIATGMQDAAACLEAIDVVDARMRDAIHRSLDAGALAAKQSGAGLGGAILALAPDAQTAEIIAQRHSRAGLPIWTLEIAP